MKGRIICIDVDGTLTNEICFTEKECEFATPRTEVIARVNEIHQTNFVVIYTARRDHLIPVTLRWLRRNGVYFHAFSNNKCPTDVGYVDDKSITIRDFLNKEEVIVQKSFDF